MAQRKWKYPSQEITLLRDLAHEMQNWMEGHALTNGDVRYSTEEKAGDDHDDFKFFKEVRNTAQDVVVYILRQEWISADFAIDSLTNCGKQMLYNRVGKLLDAKLGKASKRQIYIDPAAKREGQPKSVIAMHRIADEIIYFG